MPNVFVRILLFLSSYAPLILIFAFQAKTTVAIISFAVAAAVPVIVLFSVLKSTRNFAATRAAVVDASSKEAEAMSYIVTYLIVPRARPYQSSESSCPYPLICCLSSPLR